MTDDKLYTSLSANTIMAILTNHVQRTRLIKSSTDKHYSLDSEDNFRSGCRNVSHQQQFFSELHSHGRSHYTNYVTCKQGTKIQVENSQNKVKGSSTTILRLLSLTRKLTVLITKWKMQILFYKNKSIVQKVTSSL